MNKAELPLPAIDPEILEVIAEVMHHAFNTLLQERIADLWTGTEAEVNGLMRGRLCAFLNPRGDLFSRLWRQLVNTVVLGQETPSYDGTHLEKRPDINIHLTDGHPALPLVAECKLIDQADGKSARMYCDDGVARFLTGEYGWAGRDAFMVAYVRDETLPMQSLNQLFIETRDPNALGHYGVQQALVSQRDIPFGLYRSVHSRMYSYTTPPNAGGQPGPIALWHLWLTVPATM